MKADKFTPADSLYIPTGEIKSVEGTPMAILNDEINAVQAGCH